MAMNIYCKFEKASYNIVFVRAVIVKSLYTLQRRHNKAKSVAIVWIQKRVGGWGCPRDGDKVLENYTQGQSSTQDGKTTQ